MPNLRSAVLLVDFQNEFTSQGGKLYDKLSNFLQNTRIMEKVPEFVSKARNEGAMIIHSPLVIDSEASEQDDDQVITTLREEGLFKRDTWNSDLSEELPIKETDYLLQHRETTSVWKGTSLKKLLEKEGIDVLFIAGFLTDVCILQAVKQANELIRNSSDDFNIEINVLSDGTAAYSNKTHINMITEVLPKYCNVISVESAEEMLKRNVIGRVKMMRKISAMHSTFDPLKKLRMAMVDKWLPGDRLIRFLDYDGDGQVTYQEFYDFLNHFGLLTEDFDPRRVFDILDMEGDGEIPTQVVVDAIKAREDDIVEDPDADRLDIIKANKLQPFPSDLLVSLVAHNNMKPSMMKFVKDNITFFSRVKLVTTGSTGRALKSLGLDVAHLVASGPLGGDQEIGGLIAQGKVCAVFFFVDPLNAHPHASDIDALNRICCVHDIMFANNPSTATALVYSLENSAFGYSCLCGMNKNYHRDSSIVKNYKHVQQKVIADVSVKRDEKSNIISKDIGKSTTIQSQSEISLSKKKGKISVVNAANEISMKRDEEKLKEIEEEVPAADNYPIQLSAEQILDWEKREKPNIKNDTNSQYKSDSNNATNTENKKNNLSNPNTSISKEIGNLQRQTTFSEKDKRNNNKFVVAMETTSSLSTSSSGNNQTNIINEASAKNNAEDMEYKDEHIISNFKSDSGNEIKKCQRKMSTTSSSSNSEEVLLATTHDNVEHSNSDSEVNISSKENKKNDNIMKNHKGVGRRKFWKKKDKWNQIGLHDRTASMSKSFSSLDGQQQENTTTATNTVTKKKKTKNRFFLKRNSIKSK